VSSELAKSEILNFQILSGPAQADRHSGLHAMLIEIQLLKNQKDTRVWPDDPIGQSLSISSISSRD